MAIGQNADDGAAITAEEDQTTFEVKYLGSTPVDSPASAVAEAVKTILVMVSYFQNQSHNKKKKTFGQTNNITDYVSFSNDDKSNSPLGD